MPDYYNSGNRNSRGNDRQQGGRYSDSSRGGYDDRRYSSFEEGYTSADSRSRQNTGYSRGQQSQSGYDGRFIDAGDRYMRSQGGYSDQQSRYQQGYDAYAENSGYSQSRGYSSGFEDDFDAEPADTRYTQHDGGYADSGRYQRTASRQAQQGGYRQEEYYDRAPAQNSGQPAGRDYYAQSDRYDQPRRNARAQQYQQYDSRYDQRYEQDYDQDYDDFDDDLAEDNRRSVQRTSNARQDYYSAPARTAPARNTPVRSAKRGSGDIIGSVIDWFNRLDSRQMTLMLGGAALVLIGVIVVICLVMQADSCGSCAGGNDIPVVEQGDGEEAYNNGQNFYDGEEFGNNDASEVVSTSDGMITIDETLDTDDFTVSVTGADGSYSRTDVYRAQAASLVIAEQNETGFEFTLEVKGDGTMGSLSGYAYFCAEREAIYEGAQGLLNFSFGSSGITVYQVDIIDAFTGMSPDGIYVEGTPSYVEDEAEQSGQLGLDANIRTSDAVSAAINSMLSEKDAALLDFIFANGTQVVYDGSEKGYDKNGTEINIDAQLGAVKYYAFIDGTGEELVMICTADIKVYIGICDGMEYRYYTNDPDYAETAPKSISGQAKGKSMELVYQQ